MLTVLRELAICAWPWVECWLYLLIEPYQPWFSLSSGATCWAYEGCKSSRRGGWTLTIPPFCGRKPVGLAGPLPLVDVAWMELFSEFIVEVEVAGTKGDSEEDRLVDDLEMVVGSN